MAAAAVRALDADLQRLGAEALAVAVGAAQVDVGQELHLDVLEAVAAAGRAAAVAGIEAERAGGIFAQLRLGLGCKARADFIEGTDVAGGIGARGAADRRLIDQHRGVDQLGALESIEFAGRLGGLAMGLLQRRVQHVLHQRRLAGARNPGQANQAMQRQLDIDAPQIVLGRANEADRTARRGGLGRAVTGAQRRQAAPAGKPGAGGRRADAP